MLFTETDAKASEDSSFIQATVWVKGAQDGQRHIFNLTTIPLTLGKYRAEPDKYGNSCDSIINRTSELNIDPAEGEFQSVYVQSHVKSLLDLTWIASFSLRLKLPCPFQSQ